MLKQFQKEKRFGRRSVARDIEIGMLEQFEKAKREKQIKRVKKQQMKYV